MPKRIVLLSDGTGNSAGKLFKTNVWRVYQSLDLADPNLRAIYDDGVGTDKFAPLALLGGAMGLGLARNVRDLYTFLCRTYEDGDKIYAFGFSRGAFTIRTLVGLITSQGLVSGETDAELARNVRHAYARHREAFKTNWRLLFDWARELMSPNAPKPAPKPLGPVPDIHFLGLWDTVAAYGLPIDELQRGIDRYFRALTFPDRDLSCKVLCARHALSIDDERRTFHPVLWNEHGERNADRVHQVWFSGVHSDVGGGYAKDTLSFVPLVWIMREASKADLTFKPGAIEDFQKLADMHGELHDSRKGLAAYYRYAPRRIETLCNDDYAKVQIDRPKIHESVFARIQDGRTAYAPLGIPADYDIVTADGSLVRGSELQAGDGNAQFESDVQAAARAGSSGTPGVHERAWDYVWHRRILYFVTLGITLFLAAFPALFQGAARAGCHGPICFFSTHLIRPLGSMLPAVLNPWFDVYAARPLLTLLTIAALVLSMLISGRVAGAISESSERAWQRLKPGREISSTYVPGFVYKLRNAPSLVSIYLGVARSVLPSLFALGIVVAGAWTLLHGAYSWANASLECAPSPRVAELEGTAAPIVFQAGERCRATALRLKRGVTYEVGVDATQNWRNTLLALRDPMHPFTSRGTLNLGPTRTARMSLTDSANQAQKQPRVHLVAKIGDHVLPLTAGEFTAPQSGELFVFVDDVVAAFPPLWSYLYAQDQRTATITVAFAKSRQPLSRN